VLQSNTALIGVMLAAGGVVFDVIKAVAVAVQPLLPVTVTE
jgi:hypothetical protein